MKAKSSLKYILPIALVGIGAAIYFGSKSDTIKNLFKSKATKDEEAAAAAAATAAAAAQQKALNTPRPTTTSNPFTNAEEVKKFQDWLDSKHANWLQGKNLNKGSGYGNFGTNTAAAYNTYGQEYKAYKDLYTYTPSILAPAPKNNPLDTFEFKL